MYNYYIYLYTCFSRVYANDFGILHEVEVHMLSNVYNSIECVHIDLYHK